MDQPDFEELERLITEGGEDAADALIDTLRDSVSGMSGIDGVVLRASVKMMPILKELVIDCSQEGLSSEQKVKVNMLMMTGQMTNYLHGVSAILGVDKPMTDEIEKIVQKHARECFRDLGNTIDEMRAKNEPEGRQKAKGPDRRSHRKGGEEGHLQN